MNTACPVCHRAQVEGLLCHRCTTMLEKDLGDIPAILVELDVTIARMDRVPVGGSRAQTPEPDEEPGLASIAHTRNTVGWRAVHAADDLGNCLTSWAYSVTHKRVAWARHRNPTTLAASMLLAGITEIRRHPDVRDLFGGITEAINHARQATDQPDTKTVILVGPCPEADEHGAPCPGDVYAIIPTEEDRPGKMECRADGEHRWSSMQWLRAGKRILGRMEQIKREGAA